MPALVEQARAEQFHSIDRLMNDWLAETNRFDLPGETLIGGYTEDRLVAIGGLNRDPYGQAARTGRLRRFYVLPEFRRMGVGRQLVDTLLDHASGHFEKVRLRTNSGVASKFYENCGFVRIDDPEATHEWLIGKRT